MKNIINNFSIKGGGEDGDRGIGSWGISLPPRNVKETITLRGERLIYKFITITILRRIKSC
jgi:hypothetical protein